MPFIDSTQALKALFCLKLHDKSTLHDTYLLFCTEHTMTTTKQLNKTRNQPGLTQSWSKRQWRCLNEWMTRRVNQDCFQPQKPILPGTASSSLSSASSNSSFCGVSCRRRLGSNVTSGPTFTCQKQQQDHTIFLLLIRSSRWIENLCIQVDFFFPSNFWKLAISGGD